MERNDIVVSQVKFLRKLNQFRQIYDTGPVVYQYETWANQNHTWENPENIGGLKVPMGKDIWPIVCHTGSPSFGFVKISKLIFRCKSGSSEDNHSQINEKWFIDILVNLE